MNLPLDNAREAGPVFDLRAVTIGAIVSLVGSAVVAVATALMLHLTSMTEAYISVGNYYAGFLVLLIGGGVGARYAGKLGWLHGGMAALLASTVAMLLLSIVFPGGISLSIVFRQAALATLAGAIGGIISVNL